MAGKEEYITVEDAYKSVIESYLSYIAVPRETLINISKKPKQSIYGAIIFSRPATAMGKYRGTSEILLYGRSFYINAVTRVVSDDTSRYKDTVIVVDMQYSNGIEFQMEHGGLRVAEYQKTWWFIYNKDLKKLKYKHV